MAAAPAWARIIESLVYGYSECMQELPLHVAERSIRVVQNAQPVEVRYELRACTEALRAAPSATEFYAFLLAHVRLVELDRGLLPPPEMVVRITPLCPRARHASGSDDDGDSSSSSAASHDEARAVRNRRGSLREQCIECHQRLRLRGKQRCQECHSRHARLAANPNAVLRCDACGANTSRLRGGLCNACYMQKRRREKKRHEPPRRPRTPVRQVLSRTAAADRRQPATPSLDFGDAPDLGDGEV